MADRTYLVKITVQAEGQLQEIIKYIASELKAPKAALRLLDDIERSILSLSQLPHRVALIEEEPWHNYGIRKMPEKNFLIYFWIDEENRRVQVTAVIYAKRDQLSQLSQMDMEKIPHIYRFPGSISVSARRSPNRPRQVRTWCRPEWQYHAGVSF